MSARAHATTSHGADDRIARLRHAVEHAAHLLPAQGPIQVFVHHNTLHAFEDRPFHRAVAEAAELYGTEPYLAEEEFRRLHATGRITDSDLDWALAERWRDREPAGAGPMDDRDLERLAMLHRLEAATRAELRWSLEEGDVLRRIRDDVAPEARRRLLSAGAGEAATLAALWEECRATPIPAGARAGRDTAPGAASDVACDALRGATPRLALLRRCGEDTNDLVHPILVRLAAAFLDDDSAAWPMPGRERGLFAAWRELVSTGGAPQPPWLVGLADEALAAGGDDAAARTALAILDELGVADADLDRVVTTLLLELRGWAGMTAWLEHHPGDRIAASRPVRLVDFLAVRLVYDRRAWIDVARRRLGWHGGLEGLSAFVSGRRAPGDAPATRSLHDGPWRLFHAAQLLGLDAARVATISAPERAVLLDALDAFPALERRRTWHEAYEKHYRDEFLGALAANRRRPLAARRACSPRFQVITCIDEREESFRRHLEEVDASIETFGTAGFFGLAIRYAGIDDGHEVPLCPVVVTPGHTVLEVVADDEAHLGERRHRRRRRLHRMRHSARHATRTMGRGTLSIPLLGLASALALPVQVLAPGLASRLRKTIESRWLPEPSTHLVAARSETEALGLEAAGFTTQEKVDRLTSAFENIGLRSGWARLVIVLGHGSSSMNNPHESAHDCGACGGRHGGANARLFADFANRPHVRRELATRGIAIPDSTWFVGGIHNTSSDGVELFDLDRVPEGHRVDLAAALAALDEARARSAHERCRRFASAPSGPDPRAALRHVEVRSEVLFEPRPELGHCTNAACVVGRRELTRGLFLDRRSFLVSYDAGGDPTGSILERTLAAVGPVGAGISLEYYFSFVDMGGYGCGTKLPHNVVGMLGVMDGASSDLRTGLPRQMTEVHEPMRLLLVVEAETSTLEAIASRQEEIRRLVTCEWIQLVSLSPADGSMRRWTPRGWVDEATSPAMLPTVPSSASWYAGARDFLAPAFVDGEDVHAS